MTMRTLYMFSTQKKSDNFQLNIFFFVNFDALIIYNIYTYKNKRQYISDVIN